MNNARRAVAEMFSFTANRGKKVLCLDMTRHALFDDGELQISHANALVDLAIVTATKAGRVINTQYLKDRLKLATEKVRRVAEEKKRPPVPAFVDSRENSSMLSKRKKALLLVQRQIRDTTAESDVGMFFKITHRFVCFSRLDPPQT